MTQETKSVKTWGGFNLAILKVKQQNHYERIEVCIIATQTTNILLLPRIENLLPRPHDSSESTDYFFLWPLQNTNTHVYDFKIPLKGLATQTLMFVTPIPPLKVQIISTFDDQREFFRNKTLNTKEAHSSLSKKFYKNMLWVSFIYWKKQI